MLDLIVADTPRAITAMSEDEIADVRKLESANLARPQIAIATEHAFHAGVYARTIVIPAGVLLTGALIKRATLLIMNGDAMIYMSGGAARFQGYNVLPASANRKQAFVALSDTSLTMIFATHATTVEDAEAEFTDEAPSLFSRAPGAVNYVFASGE